MKEEWDFGGDFCPSGFILYFEMGNTKYKNNRRKTEMENYMSFPFTPRFSSFNSGKMGGEGMDNKESTPLITTETKEYLFRALNQCYETQMQMYSRIWNTLAVIMVLMVIGCLLYMCYSIRISPEQQKKRRLKTQQLVLAKMREMKEMNQYTQPNGITFLPVYQNKGY